MIPKCGFGGLCIVNNPSNDEWKALILPALIAQIKSGQHIAAGFIKMVIDEFPLAKKYVLAAPELLSFPSKTYQIS